MDEAPKTANTSILIRVRSGESQAWQQLVLIYGPVVYDWGRACGLQDSDATDVMQATFTTVAARINQHSGGRFRGWLWSIFRSRLMDHHRARAKRPVAIGGSTANLNMQKILDLPPEETEEDRSSLLMRVLESVKEKIEEHTWTAFWRTTVENGTAADVAADLGVEVWVVHNAKSRVLKRLREELTGLEAEEILGQM